MMDTRAPGPLLDLADIGRADSREVGGKAHHLGLLARFGLPVPETWVLPVSACQDYLQSCNEIVQERQPSTPDWQQADLAQHPLPDALVATLTTWLQQRGWHSTPLAVRSSAPREDSATASFAGIYLSRLNVIGPSCLLDAVREVLISLWTPQAMAYREHLGIGWSDPAMAVIIMPMVPARAAGIAFTCDPRSGRDDQIVIQAQWGLGESLVNGEADGDEYRVQEDPLDTRLSLADWRCGSKTTWTRPAEGGDTLTETMPEQRGHRRVLDEHQILELAGMLRDAAQALDFSRAQYDMEWVWDGRQFWLVQARPVTVLPRYSYPPLQGQPTIWSNANISEVLPYPMTALDWCHGRRMVNLMIEENYRRAGYPLLPGLQRARLFQGRPYLDLGIMQFEVREAFGLNPSAYNRLMGGHYPEIRVGRTSSVWQRLGYMVRYVIRAMPAVRRVHTHALHADQLARTWLEEAFPADNHAAAACLQQRWRQLCNQKELILAQSSGGQVGALRDRIETLYPGHGDERTAALMAGGPPTVTAQQGYALVKLAEVAGQDPVVQAWLSAPDRRDEDWETLPECAAFKQAFRRFLASYGHRATYESHWHIPRWSNAPGYLFDTILGLQGTRLETLLARQQETRRNAWSRLRADVPWHKRIGLARMVRNAQRESCARELARSSSVLLGAAMQTCLLQLGQRLVESGALIHPALVFHLSLPEILRSLDGQVSPAGIAARIAHRLAQRAVWEQQSPPDTILEAGLTSTCYPVTAPPDTVLRGIAVSGGRVAGIARIIHHPSQGHWLKPGEILVAPSSDPSWTPLFLKAAGVATAKGGYMSHSAIVAREFGLPAVVNLPGLLSRIQDGQYILVDGTAGTVCVTAPPPETPLSIL